MTLWMLHLGDTCAWPAHLDEGHTGPKPVPHFSRQAVCPAWSVSTQMKGHFFFFYTKELPAYHALCQ